MIDIVYENDERFVALYKSIGGFQQENIGLNDAVVHIFESNSFEETHGVGVSEAANDESATPT